MEAAAALFVLIAFIYLFRGAFSRSIYIYNIHYWLLKCTDNKFIGESHLYSFMNEKYQWKVNIINIISKTKEWMNSIKFVLLTRRDAQYQKECVSSTAPHNSSLPAENFVLNDDKQSSFRRTNYLEIWQ